MALPNPTSLVSVTSTLGTSDILSGTQVVSRIVPAVVFKALNVQYQGFLNLPVNTGYVFSPLAPVVSFAAVYVRNIGGSGSGNTNVLFTLPGGPGVVTVANLDVGAFFLYISPALSAVPVNAITAGVNQIQLLSGTTTSSNLEILAAG